MSATTNERAPSVMFIAGEPSGDAHASAVIAALKEKFANADVWGIGGDKMVSAGLRQVMPFEPFNKMGYLEVLGSLPFFLSAKKKLIKMMSDPQTRPDVLVCIDYSGFNMPMMKTAHKLNIPVVWYIAPMVWAWKKKRAEVLGKYASHIAVIFPFEVEYFSQYKSPVTFVGNPLVEALSHKNPPRKKFASDGKIKLAIIPGSRRQEIKNMLSVMLDGADMLKAKYPQVEITVSKFGKSSNDLFDTLCANRNIKIFTGNLRDLLQESDLALVTSGTATLETALLGVPMLIAYKTSRASYAIYKHFVKLEYIGLPNIIAQEEIVPECIQDRVTAEKLCAYLNSYIVDEEYREITVDALHELKNMLGEKKASVETANIISSFL